MHRTQIYWKLKIQNSVPLPAPPPSKFKVYYQVTATKRRMLGRRKISDLAPGF